MDYSSTSYLLQFDFFDGDQVQSSFAPVSLHL